MCGVAGFLGQVLSPVERLKAMAHAIVHRGPDDQGIWFDEGLGVGMAHARLSILDLSKAGHQPMQSASERYIMVFNGEIYNHRSIRTELEKIAPRDWRGHSDTETLLVAIELWGLEATLKKAKGMFGIALWDKQTQTLSLARDRMGEKPLYYGWVNGVLAFASELKSLKALPDFHNPINRDALALFMRFNSIPAPHSIYQDIYKLEPGCIVSLEPGSHEVKKARFWSTADIYRKGHVNRFSGTPLEAVTDLERVLSEAVSSQMQADVPLGAFLSGGIDSSTIVALMQSHSTQKVNTFSIGFDAKEYNEAEHARAVAKHLGTNHFDMYVTERDALDVIPLLPDIYDEPFADSSQIPTYLVSKIAKQKVTVALTGDAGDELFGGYNRYIMTSSWWSMLSKIPLPLRSLLRSSIEIVPPNVLNATLGKVPSNKGRQVNFGDKLLKGVKVLDAPNIDELYSRLISNIDEEEQWLMNHLSPVGNNFDHLGFNKFEPVERMMVRDLLGYLPTDILTKVDRAAMAVSLETRVPFLDPSVIEFSAALPLEYKIRNGFSKWVLREVLYKYVPKGLVERPKMGFGVPLTEWLRGPLRDWAAELLEEQRLQQEGFFNVALVRKKWQEHLTGKRNWHHQLWNVLMFQAWLEKNK